MELRFDHCGAEEVEVDWLPCQVHYSGETSWAGRFRPKDEEVSFRGRHFKGKSVRVPDSHAGLVLERKGSLYKAVSSLGTKFTYWNHDEEPSDLLDQVPMALSWLTVSSALAKRVDAGNQSEITNTQCTSADGQRHSQGS